ncbi:MAG TPA: hypothetical protein VJ044_18430, partial [Candidatus Hodarchaeales archaeon]|nr:hypothetical protein [Candidatus Hodarchaeales archaeon]
MNRKIILIVFLTSLLILASCKKGPAECATDLDCKKAHFRGLCDDGKCIYTPIPGECGNLKCETGENPCNCASDCKPECKGPVQDASFLEQACEAKTNECK